MDIRTLGRTGLAVPAVGMGTWRTFDVRGAAAEDNARRVVDAALACGANLFDSSPMYGRAERVLSSALVERRADAIVATKVWTPTPAEGRRQIERALAWFGGYVDIYQIHNLVAWQEHLPFLEELKARGQIGVIGATHYSHDAFDELVRVMQTGRIGQIQIPYNALDHEAEEAVLPLAEALGLGVLVMEPLGSGALVRRSPSDSALGPLSRFGIESWPQALLRWCLSDPRVHTVIPATSKPHRMTENASAGCAPWFDAEARAYVTKLAKEWR